MLVLSRKRDETVVLSIDGVFVAEVSVVAIRGDKVRLGFEAPEHVTIHRQEVHESIETKKGIGAA